MQEHQNAVQRAAMLYHDMGMQVIPVKSHDKRPAVSTWTEWQHKRQTREDVATLFESSPDANIGIITGSISGIVVIDEDGSEGAASLAGWSDDLGHALVSYTGKGRHLVFAHPGTPVGSRVGILPSVDVRADGGYIVAPPSIHKNGTVYRWDGEVGAQSLPTPAPLPPSLLKLLTAHKPASQHAGAVTGQNRQHGVVARVCDRVTEGRRNDEMARLAGRFFADGHAITDVLAICSALNAEKFDPPLTEIEVERTVRSIATRDSKQLPKNHSRAIVRRLSDVEPEEVAWLWNGFVPSGSLTMFDGDPSVGKSTIALDIAARVSTGRPMPDGTSGASGGVVLLTPEDSTAATIRPRLEAMGANLDRIAIIEAIDDERGTRYFRLPDDVDRLRELVVEYDVRLVVMDPLMAHISSKVNSWSDQETRNALMPLIKLARELNFAIIGVRHLTKKSDTTALNAASGSIAFVATARAAFLVTKDPDDDELRVLAPTKGNLATPPASLTFRIATAPNGSSRAEWCGVSAHSAASLLSAQRTPKPTKLEEAMVFVSGFLTEGPKQASELHREATTRGISAKTLERARKGLHVQTDRQGFGSDGEWYVWLPTFTSANCTGDEE